MTTPHCIQVRKTLVCLIALFITTSQIHAQNHPNIILVIADDMGVDVTNGYHQGRLMPTTPVLDSLRSVGLTFNNVFSAPKCSPSRAAIMSGKYGTNNGVTGTPGNLDLIHTSIFSELAQQTNNAYADAVIGKWHLSNPVDLQHPLDHEADYFMGFMGASVPDYYLWDKTENGVTQQDSTYVTTAFTNQAIQWTQEQEKPWFLWLAHAAPHSPFQTPPEGLYSIGATGSNFRKYLAMIEAVDAETGRLIASLSPEERENTLIIVLGDNGTPGTVLQDYPEGHGKSTLYQGGIRVPLIIAGAGVSRKGEREDALVHILDIYATILEIAGADLPGGIYNSLSFKHLLTGDSGATRSYNFSEISRETPSGFTIRDEQYKLIEFTDGSQEFYDLVNDSFEINNLLLNTLSTELLERKSHLENEAFDIQNGWSCQDNIQNGTETDIDCGGNSCTSCITTSISQIELNESIRIFPNPSQGDEVLIDFADQKVDFIQIYNQLGQPLQNIHEVNDQRVTVNLSAISPQVLFVRIQLQNGRLITKKLLKD